MKNMILAVMLVVGFFGFSSIADDAPAVTSYGHGGVVIGENHGAKLASVNSIRTSPINVSIVPFYGPTTNEISYPNFTQTVLPNILRNSWFDGWTRFGYRLDINSIIAPTSGSGKRVLWFCVTAWSDEPFDPSGLEIVLRSSDPGNSLGKFDQFGRFDLIYHPNSAVGRRIDGTLVTTGSWSATRVTEFAFVGTACSTYNGDTQSQIDSVRAWINRQGNFSITATATIRQDGEVYSGTHKIELHPTPESPRIVRGKFGEYQIYVGGIPWDSWEVLSKQGIDGTWSRVAIVKGGTYMNLPDFHKKFQIFRVSGP